MNSIVVVGSFFSFGFDCVQKKKSEVQREIEIRREALFKALKTGGLKFENN